MNFQELERNLNDYILYLKQEEKSSATITQYRKDISVFLEWAAERELTKTNIICYKEKLQNNYQATSVNVKLAAINGFFSFLGRADLKVKPLKIQRKIYCAAEKELTKKEYLRLVNTAKRQKNEKLALLLQTICGTGIRVSELCFITAEAVKAGEASIHLKGKTRTILIPGKLRHILKKYMKSKKIISGPVFVTRSGNPLDRSNIGKMMKALCEEAKVDRKKVFPHNLRHLFARCFYKIEKDIAKLADILGHSSINTTRIYIVTTGVEHRRQMESLRLIL